MYSIYYNIRRILSLTIIWKQSIIAKSFDFNFGIERLLM